MLHASFVRAYTHTLRLHMMCTPFLVYTYVILTYYCVMTVHFSLYFQIFLKCIQLVYTA